MHMLSMIVLRHTGTVHPTITVQSSLGRAGTLIVLVIAAVLSALFLLSDGLRIGWTALPFIWLIAAFFRLMWWVPRLVISQHEIIARNMWSTIRIPWGRFESASANLGLILITQDGEFRVSAAQPTPIRDTFSRDPRPLPFINLSADQLRFSLDTNQARELLTMLQQIHEGLPASQRTVLKAKEASSTTRTPNTFEIAVIMVLAGLSVVTAL
ncbi:MAG: hypothetical protein Q4P05_01945 [Actinomycetaceae bacterium]|nr:hypothetical protein [Actinomycetaceae bacterium]